MGVAAPRPCREPHLLTPRVREQVLREVEQAACRARVLVEASSLASLAADSRGFLRRMAVVAESER